MYDLDKHKKDEQEFWQAQMFDPTFSPIDPTTLSSVTGSVALPSGLSPTDAVQLVDATPIADLLGE